MIAIRTIDGLTRGYLVALLEEAERSPALERWALFIERGPVGKNLKTAGPNSPYDGMLFLYDRGEPAILSSVGEQEMRHKVTMGQFNMVVRTARTESIPSAVHVALLT